MNDKLKMYLGWIVAAIEAVIAILSKSQKGGCHGFSILQKTQKK